MGLAAQSNDRVYAIMNEIVLRMKSIFDTHLRQVILFGSYARGEQDEYSDMDIMVLVDVTDEEVKKYHDMIVEVVCDISLRYGVLPSIISKNYQHFYHWVPFLPFYRHVKTEGVEYYAN